jgi:hypothetical protein
MKTDSIKGYTIGDNTNKDKTPIPGAWIDEKVPIRATSWP